MFFLETIRIISYKKVGRWRYPQSEILTFSYSYSALVTGAQRETAHHRLSVEGRAGNIEDLRFKTILALSNAHHPW